jgi:Tfp pilus assembly protein PilF
VYTSQGWYRRAALAVTVIGLVLAAIGHHRWYGRAPLPAPTRIASSDPQVVSADFVGGQVCRGCHAPEYSAWQASHHAKAMQHATDATVLGNFNNGRLSYNGIASTFFRRDGKFFIATDGANGKLAEFEIVYTIGLYPLQQYLVAFPDGRVQTLPFAWDARPRELGGGRWYHLYPNDRITYKDPLHWTRLNQNWNWMCADCHTTKLERNYNTANNTYATTWVEFDVACEACHGPGSRHVAWANHAPGTEAAHHGLIVALDERAGVTWLPIAATGNAVRSAPLASNRELGVCAQCHSRRAPFTKEMDHDGRLLDTHDIELLSAGLYFDDGQQYGEVYEIGSFLQSKMHARGVTCSDCHEPHSGQLRAAGNAVCTQCHSPVKYDAAAHTLHRSGSRGAQCAACHMPTRTYMGVDQRRDHSIRIPRPDLSAKLGTPNACTGCHTGHGASWAAAVIEHAFGPERKGFQSFGVALHDARTGVAGAPAKLLALVQDKQAPAIGRATALADMRPYLSASVVPAIEAGVADQDPMVRGAALDTLLAAPEQERTRLAIGLIDDPSAIVRIKAARALAILPMDGLGAPMQARLDRAYGEYIASQRANADRPEAHLNLGLFYSERREPAQAEAEYQAALVLEPDFVPAYVNIADLYRSSGRESDAEAALQRGLEGAPGSADLSHALGLLRVRQGRVAEALALLKEAAHAAPSNPRYVFVYGVALHDSGQQELGIGVLEEALKRFPSDPDLLSALAAYARDAGDTRRARAYAGRLSDRARP